MTFITLNQVGVSTPKPLFRNLSLTIGENCRLGIVAGNGNGKTTLLRCLAGFAEPTDGAITSSRGLRLGYVAQDTPFDLLSLSLFECLRLALPHDQRDEPWRVEILLDMFEFPENIRDLPINALSGGWQKLALIARAWASEPDALLLDEPTNHLDLSKIQFLEHWIEENTKRMPLIVVSHDRRFLDHCTTHTLFLRPEASKLYAHPYTIARQLLAEDDATEKTKLEQDMKEADRLRRSANELKNIGINSRSDAAQKKSKQLAARASEIESKFREPHKERSGQIKLSSRDVSSRVLLSMDDVTVRTPDGRALFKTGKFKILSGERIVLLGANGTGKSQLIKLIRSVILGSIEAAEIKICPNIVIGYADQQMSQLPDHETPFDFITTRFQIGDQRSRTLLAGVGFSVDRQNCPLKDFSLGQKARLGMLALRLTEPNFYLLDEPTNHVDIQGQEKLEAEILEQKATGLIVSHDRSFVQAIGTRFLKIEKGRLIEDMT